MVEDTSCLEEKELHRMMSTFPPCSLQSSYLKKPDHKQKFIFFLILKIANVFIYNKNDETT